MAKEKIAPVNKTAKNIAIVDDGTKEIPIVNKYGKLICKIHFRPADFSIIDRYNAMMLDFDAMVDPLKNLSLNNDGTSNFEKDWQTLKGVENTLKDRINALLDSDDADAIFATRNPFSSVGGKFYCFHVLNALEAIITEAVEEEAALSQQRMSAYLTDLETPETDNTKEDTANVGAVADKS